MSGAVGTHLLADFHGVAAPPLCDARLLADCMRDAARRCRLTPLGEPVVHRFPGGGITGFLLLAESHIAIHTYPERGFMALDVFSCGACDPEAALVVFRAALRPENERVTFTERGMQGVTG